MSRKNFSPSKFLVFIHSKRFLLLLFSSVLFLLLLVASLKLDSSLLNGNAAFQASRRDFLSFRLSDNIVHQGNQAVASRFFGARENQTREQVYFQADDTSSALKQRENENSNKGASGRMYANFRNELKERYSVKSLRNIQNASRESKGFRLTTLILDPSKRLLNLPLNMISWNSNNVFVIDINNNKIVPKSLKNLDDLLHSLGIKYTRAIAPQDLSDETLSKYHPVRSMDRYARRWRVRDYELQFALAHYELWAHMHYNKIPFALIFEFDALFLNPKHHSPSLYSRIQKGLMQLNLVNILRGKEDPFDIVLLSRIVLTSYGEYKLTTNITKCQPSLGTHAYILSQKAATKLLLHATLDRPVNEIVWSVPNLEILALDPPLESGLDLYTCKNKPCRDSPSQEKAWFSFLHAQKRSIELGKAVTSKKSISNFHRIFKTPKMLEGQSCGSMAQCFIKSERANFDNQNIVRDNNSVANKKRYGDLRFNLDAMVMPSNIEDWQVYVINLKDDVERFEVMYQELKSMGFGKVTRSQAIDPTNKETLDVFSHLVSPTHLSSSRSSSSSTEASSNLTLGEIGCALSHYMVWVEMASNRIPYAIVFEDDIEFVNKFGEVFEKRIAEANSHIMHAGLGFDVLYLGRIMASSMFHEPVLSAHLVQAAISWCTYAYIVTLQGANKLIDDFFVDDPIDLVWWKIPGMKFLALQPVLVHDVSDKDNAAKRFRSRTRGT